jgi:hypothetical protein
VLGKARKIGGLNAWLSEKTDEPYFVIEVAYDLWLGMTTAQKRALVDHELSHCRIKYSKTTGEPSLYIAPHDLEEFNAIVERHGLWRDDVQKFLDAAHGQMNLLEGADDEAES